ncbi:CPXCG motif-containing cysteine-rich protein [Paraferrimonas sp. SM1919]|uniref:CPXCG motif-containing cysteine-rich protein n=1 Tax=Paraferrimonas sp. SM1919 TaxID=2662263 RepID=UPI0013D6A1A2|nr:CPXCG motif-containing cysteine-rich protein [Paraferrimonas sp. SM1919]
MLLVNHKNVSCPFCGQPFTLTLDATAGDQDYIEDCPTCCNPVHCHMHINEQNMNVELTIDSDNEYY